MADFILIHGAFQGAWVWTGVEAGLKMRGHSALALDLPGAGQDATEIPNVTFDAYVSTVSHAIQSRPGKVVLVGHSMGGMVIAAASEALPQRVQQQIYLSGYLPCDGDCANALSALLPVTSPARLRRSEDKLSISIEPDSIPPALMEGCEQPVINWACHHFKPQAMEPLRHPVALSPERSGTIPRDYILCTKDKMFSPDLQRKMLERVPCRRVIEVPYCHSPHLTAPEHIALVLHELCEKNESR